MTATEKRWRGLVDGWAIGSPWPSFSRVSRRLVDVPRKIALDVIHGIDSKRPWMSPLTSNVASPIWRRGMRVSWRRMRA